MLHLLLLRHAKSSWDDPAVADHDRPLNARGIRDAPRVGRLIRERGWVPARIVTSSATRAEATARLVAEHCGYAGPIVAEQRLYHAGPEVYAAVLREELEPASPLLIVGHNPGLEEFLHWLTGADETLPTAALANVSLRLERWEELGEAGAGVLKSLWRPKEPD